MFVSRSFETKTGLLKNVKCIDGDLTPFIIMDDWNAHYDLIMSYVRSNNTVIQAGGNCGLYARLYATVFDSVFTFEPDPINFSCLAENCKLNRIVKFNTALANKNGMLNMNLISTENFGMTKVVDVKENVGYSSYGITVDSLTIPNVSLIHLDIEGYEYEALLGAKKTIEKWKPTIVLEMTEKQDQIYNFMEKISYKEQEVFSHNDQTKNSLFVSK